MVHQKLFQSKGYVTMSNKITRIPQDSPAENVLQVAD